MPETLKQLDNFRLLLDGLPDAVLLIDPSGRIVDANVEAEAVLGYTRGELVGLCHAILLPERLREAHAAHRERYMAGPTRRPMGSDRDLVARRKDGAEIPVEISLSPTRVDGGAVVVAVVRDITARKQAEEALERQARDLVRSNADLEQFAYVASHDLQEPLRMVASYVQLLGRRYRGRLDGDADEFIDFAVDGVKRMQELINDLLAYSRVGTRGGEFQPADTGTILDRVVANLRLSIEECGAVVTSGSLPTVLVDPSQWSQLFQNLISNAIKFRRDEPPRVHVSAERGAGGWIFTIRDNGVGIDPQYRDRIFLIFQRLHNRGRYPGTGIGLAICKKIVERHGGQIWIESEPGRGSAFHFSLPDRPR